MSEDVKVSVVLARREYLWHAGGQVAWLVIFTSTAWALGASHIASFWTGVLVMKLANVLQTLRISQEWHKLGVQTKDDGPE